jgi:phosphoribosylformylglycinamidine cyclo-ligase
VDEDEMRRTFNLGVGLVAVVERGAGARTVAALEAAGERAWSLGTVQTTSSAEPARVSID